MKTLHKTVLLSHSAHDMFALVTDVPRYPEFLPWCASGQVIETTEHGMVAQVGSVGGAHLVQLAAGAAHDVGQAEGAAVVLAEIAPRGSIDQLDPHLHAARDHDDLAGLHLANELGLDQVERAGLARQFACQRHGGRCAAGSRQARGPGTAP